MKKYFELITIPIAVALLVAYNALSEWLNVMLFTWEKVSKVFFALLFFLIAVGIIRIVMIFMFSEAYRNFDFSFSNTRLGWHQLSEKERLIYASSLFAVLLLAFALILSSL